MQDREQSCTTSAVIYAAKSTVDKRGSIETQISDCCAMAEREGWEVVADYSDENASAYHGDRGPGLVEAREHAARVATEKGGCVLLAQHSDRFARGDGLQARHLAELWFAVRREGVELRTVQDDSTFTNPLLIMALGERNAEDSRRKAAATSAGRHRAAKRGEWCGNVPDGYRIERTPQGSTIVRCVVKDEERIEVYVLLFNLMCEGATVNQVVAEFRHRGFRTAPLRARPRPFDAVRLNKAIVNPFYAGLMRLHGEIVGEGKWSAYIEPDEWHRLQRERSERAHHRPRRVGRPPTGLLAGLARCECGGAMIQQHYGPRKDGSRRRTYTCQRHMHGAGACDVKAFDAGEVESLVLGGLDRLLADAGAWAQALLAGRDAERTRLEAVVREAAWEAADCERQIEQLAGRYDAAVATGNEAAVELAERAWKKRREVAQRAEVRKQAAEDALAVVEEEPVEDADAALARMWRSLSGDLDAVKGERAALNETLRRYFSRFVLSRKDGELRIVPVLTLDAMARGLRNALEGKPSNVQVREHGVDTPFDDAAWTLKVSGPPVLTLDQPGTQPLSHLPHNTRPGSSRGTAGGSPRRSKRDGSSRPPARSRS